VLLLNGKEEKFDSVADAAKAGIAVIYQELALVDELTVAENIFLGREPRQKAGFIDWLRIKREAREWIQRFHVELDPDAQVGTLGMGQKQLVEIVKALSRDSQLLILDEPTAALAEHEVQVLLNILRDLRQQGIGCVYISHKLEEVYAISDYITVLRDGSTVFTTKAAETPRKEVIRQMVGREITDLFPPRISEPGEIQLQVHGLSVEHPDKPRRVLDDITFDLRAGEVLGVGGLMGAGRTELLMHLYGAYGRRLSGAVQLAGQPLATHSPEQCLRQGLALVTEDRRRLGLVLEQQIGFNLSLSALADLVCKGMLDQPAEHYANQQQFEQLQIKATGLAATASKLSGGNQQKIVLGKVLMTKPKVLMLDEPTRGIDVGAKQEIYALIRQFTQQGMAVLLVSSELPELLGLSDQIMMLNAGRVGGIFSCTEATQEKLLEAAVKA
jgi:D-xylose transport system ATP-binding protein